MKRWAPKPIALVLAALVIAGSSAACKGPPTLVPTLAFPATKTPVPSQTPVPRATEVPSRTPTPTETPIPMARVRRQATLRTGPGVQYDVAGTAQFAQTLVVYARYNGWFQVNSEGDQWIIEGKVTINVDLDAIPELAKFPPDPTATGTPEQP